MITSNSDYICYDLTEITIWNGWDALKQYLSMVEDYLKKTTDEFEAWIREQESKLPSTQRDEFKADHVEEFVQLYEEFPRLLRNSFLVSACSLLEYDLGVIRKRFKYGQRMTISASDFKGDKSKQSKLRSKLENLGLSNCDTFAQEISNYYKVRNCIVHKNGLLKGDKKELIEYVRLKGIILEETTEPEIALTKKFCEEVVETMQNFIDAAYKAYITKRKEALGK